MTGLARCGFKGEPAYFGQGGDRCFPDFKWQFQLASKAAHKGGVEIGLATAQAMVEMADDELAASLSEQVVQEDDRVTAAGDSDEHGFEAGRLKVQKATRWQGGG